MPGTDRSDGETGGWLSQRDDWSTLSETYTARAPWSYVVVDDLLSPAMAVTLRDTLLAHWAWRQKNPAARQLYLPTPELAGVDGLAAEMQQVLPEVLGKYAFVEHWAFLHQRNNGLRPHTDVGSVSVDVWLTSDESRVDGGGLLVHRLRRPSGSLAVDEFNTSRWTDTRFARAKPPLLAHVAYKWNRAVIFDARLFHQTAPMRFRCADSVSTRLNFNLLFDDPVAYRTRPDRYRRIYDRCEALSAGSGRAFDELPLDAAEAIWGQAVAELAQHDQEAL